VDRTGSGSCLAAGFDISGVELSGSATQSELVRWTFREIGRDGGSLWDWLNIEYRVQWRCLIL
jgi:hypothetical protein